MESGFDGESAVLTRPKVMGVGVNDAGYPIHKRAGNKITWTCPFYRSWKDMMQRAYSERVHDARPSYEDCYVCEDWHLFSAFKKWMSSQEWQGMQLDKDILVPGNRIYSPDRCIFITHALNSFLNGSQRPRGPHPAGVHMDKARGKYKAYCCNPFAGKREFLGSFCSAELAHKAWFTRKRDIALAYAAEQSDERIASALRSRFL